VISRVAEHCFWLGRYLERAESTSRVLRVTYGLALDSILPPAQVWGPAVTVSGEDDSFGARHEATRREDGELVQQFLTWDQEVPSSLLRSVMAARENARSIREVVSLEAWEAINELYLWLQSRSGRGEYDGNRDAFYRHVRAATQLILGALEHTMLHDNAFDFINLGILLERVGQTARILDVHHHALMQLPPNLVREESLWLSLLRACSGFEPFMKRSAGRVTPAGVAGFLILEPNFPRSILFCLHQAYERLANIRSPTDPVLPRLESQRRLSLLEGFLLEESTQLDSTNLHELLTRVVEETATICAELGTELLAAPHRPEDTETVPVPSAGEVLVREGATQGQTQIGGSQS
jgi:uncharacterized alpha-E superfamily protein